MDGLPPTVRVRVITFGLAWTTRFNWPGVVRSSDTVVLAAMPVTPGPEVTKVGLPEMVPLRLEIRV